MVELGASDADVGVQEKVVVGFHPESGQYRVLDGNKRVVAAEAAGRLAEGRAVPATANDVIVILGESIPALAGLTHQTMGFTGRPVASAVASGVES